MLKWIWLAVVVVIFDQLTKYIASNSLEILRPIAVMPGFNWTLMHNPGAAFSFLANEGGWQRWLFTVLASVVTLILIVWLLRLPVREKLTAAALCMVIGGAVGNLIDRIINGYVVDFIDVYYRGYHWPAFNLADSAITGGVILLLIDGVLVSIAAKRSVVD